MKFFPRQATKSIQIFRCATSGDRKYPATPTSTVEGCFLPMDRKNHALEGGQYVDPHEVYFDASTDVARSDKLVIDGTIYFVKKVFDAEFGAHPFKRASVSTEA